MARTIEQVLRDTIGNLQMQVAHLVNHNEELTEEIERLKEKLSEVMESVKASEQNKADNGE